MCYAEKQAIEYVHYDSSYEKKLNKIKKTACH